MRTRNLHYDIMRVVACLMIIGMHAPMPSDKANPIFVNWNIDFIANIPNYYLQWAIVVILTFGLSWILAFCISKLPFGDYIIGYKQVK